MCVIGGAPARTRNSNNHQKSGRVLIVGTHLSSALSMYGYLGVAAFSGGGAGEQRPVCWMDDG